ATTDLSLLQDIDDRVFRPTLAALGRIGRPFTGALFAGLMLTPAGPQVLEFNCRFGDPETQVLLPLLEGDLALALLGAANGELGPQALTIRDGAAAGVVIAAAGYPEDPRNGDPISGLDQAQDLGALVFHAGTRMDGDDVITNGGRVLTVVGEGPTLDNALAVAYSGVDAISFTGMQFRRDIAHTEVLKR
ncbi:MAG: phosphoribosylglycinamide synthetase C domain-containing protein, partial [Chloroflexota bacterium]